MRTPQKGFTLLEVLVATTIMAIAVVGLLSNLTTSLRNASKLTENDRAAMLGRQKLDELLVSARLPRNQMFEGMFDPISTGGIRAGWKAQTSIFDAPPNAAPGIAVLERIQLVIWWERGGETRTFPLDGYRKRTLTPEDVPPK